MPIKKIKKVLTNIKHKVAIIGKHHSKKIYIGLGVLAIAGVLYSAKGTFLSATVNGKPIYRWELVNELEKQYKKQILDGLIVKELISQEANKLAIVIPQELVLTEISKIEEAVESQGTTLDTLLSSQGITKEELIKQIELELKLEEILKDSIKVTDEEVTSYLSENSDKIPNLTFENAKEHLTRQKLGQEVQTWIAQKKAASDIKYFGKYLEQSL